VHEVPFPVHSAMQTRQEFSNTSGKMHSTGVHGSSGRIIGPRCLHTLLDTGNVVHVSIHRDIKA